MLCPYCDEELPTDRPHTCLARIRKRIHYVIDLETGRVVDDGRHDNETDARKRADEYNRRTRRTCGVFALVAAWQS